MIYSYHVQIQKNKLSMFFFSFFFYREFLSLSSIRNYASKHSLYISIFFALPHENAKLKLWIYDSIPQQNTKLLSTRMSNFFSVKTECIFFPVFNKKNVFKRRLQYLNLFRPSTQWKRQNYGFTTAFLKERAKASFFTIHDVYGIIVLKNYCFCPSKIKKKKKRSRRFQKSPLWDHI